ncbi:unnamed protein product [Effrenium voratum]|uniref:Uncharacterized protein n=1 Tax=Effrenium voratum TaxID=2562239 RepID=A0AA36JLE6_9DINO|nr:unnamed protein product [Effrenium voratum]
MYVDDVPEANMVAVALLLICLPLHWSLTNLSVKRLWASVWPLLSRITEENREDHEKKAKERRLREGVDRVREQIFVISHRIFIHASAPNVFFTSCLLVSSPSAEAAARWVLAVLTYAQGVSVCRSSGPFTARRVRLLNLGSYLLHAAYILTSLLETEEPRNELVDNVLVASRFVFSTFSLDSSLNLVCQPLVSIATLLAQRAPDSRLFASQFSVEFQILVVNVLFTYIIEAVLRSHLQALFDSADAEAMVSSFRRMLKGICDGVVLLDSSLKVHGKAESLQQLMCRSEDLNDMDFEKLLIEDEPQTFARFIASSSLKDLAAPACLRLSFRHGLDPERRIPADIFHVPVPGLFGASAFHLLAVQEDPEASPVAEAEDDRNQVPEVPRETNCPGSTSSTESMWQNMPELTEMTMLVDPKTQFFDVNQVHMSFKRHSDDVDTSSRMPTVKKFVRPTDWETIRAKLTKWSKEELGPRRMKRMRVRSPDDGKNFIVAQDVEVSSFTPPNELEAKLCIHLRDFHPDRKGSRQAATLTGIVECD